MTTNKKRFKINVNILEKNNNQSDDEINNIKSYKNIVKIKKLSKIRTHNQNTNDDIVNDILKEVPLKNTDIKNDIDIPIEDNKSLDIDISDQNKSKKNFLDKVADFFISKENSSDNISLYKPGQLRPFEDSIKILEDRKQGNNVKLIRLKK